MRQQQPGENPARTEADDNRTCAQVGRCLANHFIADIRRHVDVTVIGEPVQHRRLVANFKVDGVDEAQLGGLFTRIVAALEQGEIEQVIAGDPQALHDGRAQVFIGMVDRQLEFGDS
ncbi:hypothetical protein D9M71_817710 [compost metagenome]